MFDGSSDFGEWIVKLELVAKFQGVSHLESFLPLFLTGGAFAVYEALPKTTKEDYKTLRQALSRAFSMDRFRAYEEFTRRRLRPGEAVDVFLSDLRSLGAKVSSDLSDEWLTCAFVAGLPDFVSMNLKSACQLEVMSLGEVLERARVVMSLQSFDVCAYAGNRAGERGKPSREIRCYQCREVGHTRKFCPTFNREQASKVKCFQCGLFGHIARNCRSVEPKNEEGGSQLAPADSQEVRRDFQR